MSNRFVAAAGLETAPIQEGLVLFDPKTGKFIMFNRSAASLWTELSTPRTEEELIGTLGSAFRGVATPGKDVGEALGRFKELGLVVDCNGESAGVHSAEGKREGAQQPADYEPPSLRVLDEDELLNIFQMTAAEISVASCWWASCPSANCP